jgi:carbon-monoxide dehydrogenase medium subunit
MKPPAFDYEAPGSLAEALALKARHGDEARFLAGGQSLVPAMNFRLVRPAVLIDLNGIAELGQLTCSAAGGLSIGALVRHARVEADAQVARHQPLLSEAIHEVAHPQVRNRGTVCGNLAHADPASELPAVMVALQAQMRAVSVRGERSIAAADFFQGTYTTALETDELLAQVRLEPLASGTGTAFLELARRPGDYAMMGVAVVVQTDASGACTDARVVCCGAGDRPLASLASAAVLRGASPGSDPAALEALSEAAGAALAASIDPPGTVHASADYQRHLAQVLSARAIATAFARAAAHSPSWSH